MCLQGTMGLKGRHTVHDHKEDFKPFLCTIIGCCCLSDRKAKKLLLKKEKKQQTNTSEKDDESSHTDSTLLSILLHV